MDNARPALAYLDQRYTETNERIRPQSDPVVRKRADGPGTPASTGSLCLRFVLVLLLLLVLKKFERKIKRTRTTAVAPTALLVLATVFAAPIARCEPEPPRSSFVPPVRSAPPPATRSLLLDAYLLGSSVFAVGERGALIRSDDSGQNWDAINLSVATTLTGITFANAYRGWIVGHEGTILITSDGGLSWEAHRLKDGGDISLLDVFASDPHHALAVGAFGTCLISPDSGRTWTPRKVLDEDLHLNRLTRGRGTEFFLAGERGTLLRFEEFKSDPVRMATGYEGSFNGVLLLADQGLLAYGLRGHVFRSEDNGATWSAVAGVPPVLLSTGLKTKSGLIVLAGQARVFLVSRDGGRTFSSWDTTITTAVAKIIEAPDGSFLAFGESGVIRLRPPSPLLDSAAQANPTP